MLKCCTKLPHNIQFDAEISVEIWIKDALSAFQVAYAMMGKWRKYHSAFNLPFSKTIFLGTWYFGEHFHFTFQVEESK